MMSIWVKQSSGSTDRGSRGFWDASSNTFRLLSSLPAGGWLEDIPALTDFAKQVSQKIDENKDPDFLEVLVYDDDEGVILQEALKMYVGNTSGVNAHEAQEILNRIVQPELEPVRRENAERDSAAGSGS